MIVDNSDGTEVVNVDEALGNVVVIKIGAFVWPFTVGNMDGNIDAVLVLGEILGFNAVIDGVAEGLMVDGVVVLVG